MLEELRTRIKTHYHHHEKRYEVFIFIGGFLFDALMVKEPDELIAIVQQMIYLVIIASILHFELLSSLQKWQAPERFQKIWKFRELLLPFLLGTLLNVYSIFYIKSASFFSSLVFLLIMIGLIVLNENPTVKKSRVSFKVGLYGICLFSFFAILFPILLGYLGRLPFSLAILTTAALFYLQFWILHKKVGDLKLSLQAVLVPGASVIVFFLIFYVMGWIPPVPVNVKEQGVYHFIEKKEGAFLLSTEKEWWRFWRTGDENFKAQPGDKIYFYVQIYSPTHFSDEVIVHWLHKNQRGSWENADKVAMRISGGRKEGFRGFIRKDNYQPGSWQVQVETHSGLEISRLYFNIESQSNSPEPRTFKIIRR